MSPNSSRAIFTGFGGRNADSTRWMARAVAVILGNLLLWASAKAQVPFWPVPMTMQTYVVLTMGALFGWRLAATTISAYLAEGALGLPVFAGTPANGMGIAYMAGPTGGYLLGYLVAVVLVGFLAEERRWSRSLSGTAGALLAGEAAMLGVGCCWLAAQLGWEKAFSFGLAPFIFGDGLKVVLAVGTVMYGRRLTSILR